MPRGSEGGQQEVSILTAQTRPDPDPWDSQWRTKLENQLDT